MTSPERYQSKIPNDDVAGWLKFFREAGFDDAEIDRFMLQNDEYKVQKMPKDFRDYINRLYLDFQKEYGRPMNAHEREMFLAETTKLAEMSHDEREKYLAVMRKRFKKPDRPE